MPSQVSFPARQRCSRMRTCIRPLRSCSVILCHIFVPAFREHRPRQVWTRPLRSRSLCQFWPDLQVEHGFSPSARRLHSQLRPSYPGRCLEWTSWRFRCLEDILTGPTFWLRRTRSVSLADSHLLARGTVEECRPPCRLCRLRFSQGVLLRHLVCRRVRFSSHRAIGGCGEIGEVFYSWGSFQLRLGAFVRMVKPG